MTTQPQAASAEVQAQRLEAVSQRLTELLRRSDVLQRLRTAPSAEQWSALQTIGHMAEIVPYWLNHCRALIAAEGEPPRFGRTLESPERLAAVAHGAVAEPETLLSQFADAARDGARTIRAMSAAERAKSGTHARVGLITVAAVVEDLVVGHVEDHLAQARTALGVDTPPQP